MALTDIGSLKSDFTFNADGITGILQQYAQNGISTMKELLVKYNVDPGNLYQAITFDVEVLGTNYTMTISLPHYYVFVDKGVKGWQQVPVGAANSPYQFKQGTPPIPAKVIYDWAFKKRGLFSTRKSRKGKSISTQQALRSFSHAASRSIKKKGLKAKPFFTDTITPDYKTDLQNALSSTMKQDIIVSFQEFSDN